MSAHYIKLLCGRPP